MKPKIFLILACGFMLALSSLSFSNAETLGIGHDVDTSDPGEVLHAAWQAIVDEDYNSYIAFVHPDSRARESQEQWLSWVRKMKKVQGFKENIKFNIQKTDDSKRAAAVSEDMRVFLGMVYKDGRWWMD